MLKKTLISFCIAFFCSCSAINVYKVFRIVRSGDLEKKEFKVEIPFTYENGLIILKAKINDTGEEEFILDSGAPAGCITDSLQKKLKLSKVTDYEATDVNSKKKKVSWYIADSVTIDRLIFKNVGFASLDFSNPVVECLIRSGLIGMNMMDDCIWHFDFPNKKIILSSSIDSVLDKKSSFKIPVSRDAGGYIYADFLFNGKKKEKLLFDLGFADGFITVPLKFFKENTSGKVVTSYGNGTGGAFSISRDTVYSAKAGEISLGSVIFKEGILSAGEKTQFSFGNKILQYYYVTLDIKNNTMYLKPIAGKEFSYEFISYGCEFDFSPPYLTLGTMHKGGPAENAGLRLGDTILSINNKEADIKNYCDFLFQKPLLTAGYDSLSLITKRMGPLKPIVIKKEKML